MASRGVNKVILIGNLGQDPEIRYNQQGGAIANLSIATSESWKDKNTGQQQEKTEWHRVVIFGKLAEICGEYARKGSKLYIEGKLQTRKWQDQSGQDKYTTEVVIDGFQGQMQMLDGKGDNQGGHQGSQSNSQGQHQAQSGRQYNQPQQQSQPQNHGGYTQQQQGGFQQNNPQQQGNFNQQQQNGYQGQRQVSQQIQNNKGASSNPMEPPIDFSDDIPF